MSLRSRVMGPNTYETLVCQEANEVRRKKMVSRFWVHAESIALGVTDLISISGFTGNTMGVSCTKHLSSIVTRWRGQAWVEETG